MTKMATTPNYAKNPLNILKANDLANWYLALGMWALPGFSNDQSRLTLT